MAVFASLVVTLSILSSLSLPAFSLRELTDDGFSVDLIHRDSSISPLYNSAATHWDRISKAIQRSKTRADSFAFRSLAQGTPSPELIVSSGDFLMKLNLGARLSEINGIVDTTSAFSWIQCDPCVRCFRQSVPLFKPSSSPSYKVVPGKSKLCKDLGGKDSILGDNTCRYSLYYLNGSSSHGTISSDTLRINSTSGSPIVREGFVFGCGFENVGKFNSHETCGVISLGSGPGSLITQMDTLIGGKFSYCLLSHEHSNSRSSKMHFGNKAVVSGSGVVSTGLHFFKNSFAARFKGVSVGKRKLATIIDLSSNTTSSLKILGFLNQRIIIDSGTMLTHIPTKIYQPLEEAMKKEIKLENVGPRKVLRLCYKTPDGKMRGPVVTLHFVGADLKLSTVNTFLKVSANVHCLAFVPYDGVAMLGNLAQINFLVGYDVKRKTISFKQTDCTKNYLD